MISTDVSNVSMCLNQMTQELCEIKRCLSANAMTKKEACAWITTLIDDSSKLYKFSENIFLTLEDKGL